MAKKIGEGAKALRYPWAGYRGPRSWGSWFVIEWPDQHPDSHCEDGYKPDKGTSICESCGWVPADATVPGDGKENLRAKMEITSLERIVSRNHQYTNVMVIAYQAFIDENRKHVVGPPSFEEVAAWWRKLPERKMGEYHERYDPMKDLLKAITDLIEHLFS